MIVVSGLPRSGTSMLMQILSRGGLQCISDNKRPADEHNPNGYFEIKEIGQHLSIYQHYGNNCCIKLLSPFLKKIENNHIIIFIERNLEECFASMQKMLNRKPAKDAFKKHLKDIKKYLKNKNVIYINYNKIITNPDKGLKPIKHLIPNFKEAKKAVDPTLQHNKQ